MKNFKWIAAALILITTACGTQSGSSNSPAASNPGGGGSTVDSKSLFLKNGVTAGDLKTCSLEVPCATGSCMYLDLAIAPGTYCADGANVCQEVGCLSGSCLMLESYPAQVVCAH